MLVDIVKVDLPLFKVIPIRRAKSGQILENDVFGRNDQFIAERGTEIDEKLLTKFDNFNVRRVVIREHQDTWIPSDRRADLPTDVRILTERALNDSLAGPVRSLFGDRPETSMKNLVDDLLERAKIVQRTEWIEFLSTLQDSLDDLIDAVETTRNSLDELPKSTLDRVETVLEGAILDLGKDFLQLQGSDRQLRDYLSLFKERDRVRLKLIDFLIDHPQLITDHEDESDSESSDLPSLTVSDIGELDEAIGTDSDSLDPATVDELQEHWSSIVDEQEKLIDEMQSMEGYETLLQNLWEATNDNEVVNHKVLSTIEDQESELPERVKELIEKRKSLQKKLQSLTEESDSGSESGQESSHADNKGEGSTDSSSSQTFREQIDEFDRGNELDAVEGTMEYLRDHEGDTENYLERLHQLHETILNLVNLENDLLDKLDEASESTDDQNYLENVMEGNVELLPERLMNMNLDSTFVEKIQAYLKGWETVQYQFEELMWDLQKDEDITT
jgi:hypothetical protein